MSSSLSSSSSSHLMPVVSKIFCSPSLTTLMVRKRPHVVNGGGFVVTNCSTSTAIFSVDGCGVIGVKGELMVRDEDGASILRIQKKGGVVQALSARNRWKGYLADEDEGENKLVFTLREPRTWLAKNEVIKICIAPRCGNKDWDFEVHGSFLNKACTITNRKGAVAARVIVREMMGSKEFYQVVVQPGYDQAFVVGVIAVLDNMHGESTRC